MPEVVMEEVVELGPQGGCEEKCAIGRIRTDGRGGHIGDLALVKVSRRKIGNTLSVPLEDCIFLGPSICHELASLIPPLVFGLWAWDQLSLELGDAAVFTGSGLISRVIGQVALWRGAMPIVSIEPLEGSVPGVRSPVVQMKERETLLVWLREQLSGKSRFAAIDMDGRDWIVNLILEVSPQWGRLMFSGEAKELITVDYYNNIHKKGLDILTTRYQPTMVFQKDNLPGLENCLKWGFRILENNKMSRDLLAAVRSNKPLIAKNYSTIN